MSAAVVRLPTAARRKQRHWLNKAQAQAAEQLPQFPDIFAHPCVREARQEAEEQAKLILASDGYTALRLAVAIFRVMPEAKKVLLEAYLTVEAGRDSPHAAQALALVRFEQSDQWHRASIAKAMLRVAEEAE